MALVTTDYWPQGDFVATSLGMPDIPRVKLPHPVAGTGVANQRSIAEQTAIAEVLADMDTEIEAIEAKLAKARQIKQGMIQELLTGRTRLV